MNSLRALKQKWLKDANEMPGNIPEQIMAAQMRICADALQPFVEREEADEALLARALSALESLRHAGNVERGCAPCAVARDISARLGE